jgi:hypothetical protein
MFLSCLTAAALVVALNGFACEPEAKGGTCAKPAGECCAGTVDAAQLALGAEKGCQASMNRLIALAKESGNEATVALATNSENGCEQSKAALLALAKDGGIGGKAAPVSTAQLAVQAEHGCTKSAAELIARAKTSGNAEEVQLANRAEGGCERSKAALIAMSKTSKAEAAPAATPASN